MAYNLLTGSIYRVPSSSIALTGTFAGDGRELINTPGPNYATNGGAPRLVTFANTAGSTVNGEANLTFDGSTLIVTGEVTASIGMNANFFEGDGSRLTGITASAGTAGGIFTEINPSSAYTTSSVLIGGTTAPNHTLSLSGTLSLVNPPSVSSVSIYVNCAVGRFNGHCALAVDRLIGRSRDGHVVTSSISCFIFNGKNVSRIKVRCVQLNANSFTATVYSDKMFSYCGRVMIGNACAPETKVRSVPIKRTGRQIAACR